MHFEAGFVLGAVTQAVGHCGFVVGDVDAKRHCNLLAFVPMGYLGVFDDGLLLQALADARNG